MSDGQAVAERSPEAGCSACRWAVRIRVGRRYMFSVFTFTTRLDKFAVRKHPDVVRWVGPHRIDDVYPWYVQPDVIGC